MCPGKKTKVEKKHFLKNKLAGITYEYHIYYTTLYSKVGGKVWKGLQSGPFHRNITSFTTLYSSPSTLPFFKWLDRLKVILDKFFWLVEGIKNIFSVTKTLAIIVAKGR